MSGMSAGKNEVTHLAPASQPGPPTGQLTIPHVEGKQRGNWQHKMCIVEIVQGAPASELGLQVSKLQKMRQEWLKLGNREQAPILQTEQGAPKSQDSRYKNCQFIAVQFDEQNRKVFKNCIFETAKMTKIGLFEIVHGAAA